jgi:spore germination cell wall hydrolase CwlJ-like protein
MERALKDPIMRSLRQRLHTSSIMVFAGISMCWGIPAQASYPNPRDEFRQNPALPGSIEVSEKEKHCLATAIYFEARSESDRGQVAVGQVILNRVESEAFPDTICEVVYQGEERRNACQFSFACDGLPETASNRKAWRKASKIAMEVLGSKNLIGSIRNATFYHANYAEPSWARKMTRLATIGRHVFYRG